MISDGVVIETKSRLVDYGVLELPQKASDEKVVNRTSVSSTSTFAEWTLI